jgi:hypothetical protein
MIGLFRRNSHWRNFDSDAARYEALQRHDAGSRTISIDQIVGSLGRHGGSAPGTGLWHVSPTDLRYRQIRDLMRQGHSFAPVELYALDGAYYIVDGNHRVAAARSLGQLWIDARVIEFRPVARGQLAMST